MMHEVDRSNDHTYVVREGLGGVGESAGFADCELGAFGAFHFGCVNFVIFNISIPCHLVFFFVFPKHNCMT